MFAGTGINITTEGRKHLGAALGSRSYFEQYVGGKVEDWVGEVTRLQQIMTTLGTRGFSRLLRKFSIISINRGTNTLALRWAHGLILSNMWVARYKIGWEK